MSTDDDEITVPYCAICVSGLTVEATWTGSRGEAIAAAAQALDAHRWDDGLYAYCPDELGGETVLVTAYTMAQLGAGLLDGYQLDELYHGWCETTDAILLGDVEILPEEES